MHSLTKYMNGHSDVVMVIFFLYKILELGFKNNFYQKIGSYYAQ